ncbi:MAG: hypothetical protein ACI4JS_10510 [Oscillospiraceae bacterium]
MSSYTVGGGAIAPAVSQTGGGDLGGDLGALAVGVAAASVVAVAAVFGVGWLAWKTGKFAFDLTASAVKYVQNDMNNLRMENERKRVAAISAHKDMIDLCNQIITDIGNNPTVPPYDASSIILEIKDIIASCTANDPEQLNHQTNAAYVKLNRLIQKEKKLSEKSFEPKGLYSGQSLVDLMEDLSVAFEAASISETIGKDVCSADPLVLERSKLNESLNKVTEEIIMAMKYITEISGKYGLSESDSEWFHSCFNGIDDDIERLYRPSVSNDELKRGVKRLNDIMERYNMLAPNVERELEKRIQLYKIYAEAARAFGEPIKSIKAYQTLKDIEDALNYLKKRSERADKCAVLYNMLGAEAYMSFAWDKELEALGYSVYKRKQIVDMINSTPKHAEIDGIELPCYKWNEEDYTQIYSLGDECGLQVVVHKDGKVSMQSIALTDNEENVKSQQHIHCEQIKLLCDRLRENWFIFYDYDEVSAADEVVSVDNWIISSDNMWSKEHQDSDDYGYNRRKQEINGNHTMSKRQ